jgi:hypothetical protein
VLSLLLGQIPGVWLGARLSSTYDGHALRWLLMVILAATAVTLLGAPRVVTGAVAIVGVAIVSALIVRDRQAGQRRRTLEPELTSILDHSGLDRGVDGVRRHI